MAKSESEFSDLGSGTYYIPGRGTVVNGKLLDGDDPKQVAAFHARDDKAREQAVGTLAERDAVIVEAVGPTPEPESKES